MKKLSYLLIGLLFFGGCSYKNESIDLKSYSTQYSGTKVKTAQKIYIALVKDERAVKRTIGQVMEGKKKVQTLHSNEDFANKYKEGLTYALNIAGFNTKVSQEDADKVLEVYIQDIDITQSYDTFDKNVKGSVSIKIVSKQGNKTNTFEFKEKSSAWKSKSYSSKDLEPFLYMLYTDSINRIVAKLASAKTL